MNTKLKVLQLPAVLLGGLVALSLVLAGCGDMNDNPSSGNSTIEVSVQDLAGQMGYLVDPGTNTVVAPPTDTLATTEVLTLVVGAVVIRSRATPYDETTPITDVGDQLEQDILDSSNFITSTDLSGDTLPDTIEITIPSASADPWQIMAVGVSVTVDGPDELQAAIEDYSAYFAFHPEFLETTSDEDIVNLEGDVVSDITLEMRRACLVNNTPKGCAQYDDDKEPVVTGAVEIISVQADGVDVTTKNGATIPFPLIVRDSANANAGELSPAEARILYLRNADGIADASTITVNTTHQLSANASADCAAAITADDLLANCSSETYTSNF